eukprot:scaffold29348_cov84-Isochrysis_galbana.AAC.2
MVKRPPAREFPGPPEMGGTSAVRRTRSASWGRKMADTPRKRTKKKKESPPSRVMTSWIVARERSA